MEYQNKFRSLSELKELIEPQSKSTDPSKNQHNGKGKTVYVSLDMQGRKGKSVTIVSDLKHNPTTMEEIARMLKQLCGAGGTVKEGKIEIQGDQRDRVAAKLRELNYNVKNK